MLHKEDTYFNGKAILARLKLKGQDEVNRRLNGNGNGKKPHTLVEKIAAAHGIKLERSSGENHGHRKR